VRFVVRDLQNGPHRLAIRASDKAGNIARAADWAGKHGVRVTCNEFGVYRKVAPTEARLRWIRDVRTALEKHHIGWAMWDYAGGFSVVVQEGGRRVPDPATLESLGLKSAE